MTETEYCTRAEALKPRLYRTALLYLGGESAAVDAVDEAVYKIRMKRFISKGGIPTKPEQPEEKPAETAEDDAKEKKEKR